MICRIPELACSVMYGISNPQPCNVSEGFNTRQGENLYHLQNHDGSIWQELRAFQMSWNNSWKDSAYHYYTYRPLCFKNAINFFSFLVNQTPYIMQLSLKNDWHVVLEDAISATAVMDYCNWALCLIFMIN